MRGSAPDGTIEQAGPDQERSVRRVWIHAVALALVLAGLFAFVDNGSIAVADEAVYATQSQALVDGSWTSPRPAPDLDPTGSGVPLVDSVVVGDRIIAYQRHALYPVLLVPAVALFGYSGALAVSAFGVWCAALVAAFSARRIDHRYGAPALWITGLASPLLFDAFTLWAHSLAAAAFGLTVLSVLRVLAGERRAVHFGWAALGAVVSVLLRTEGVVIVLALATVVVAGGVRWQRRTIDRTYLGIGAALALIAIVSYVLDSRWSVSISGRGGYGTNPTKLVLGPRTNAGSAVWSSLIRPYRTTPYVATAVAAILTPLAALTARLRRVTAALPWALALLAAGAWIVALVTIPVGNATLVTGLFAAFPLLCALLLLDRTAFGRTEVWLPVGSFAIATVLLALSIHETSTMAEWGGRYFHALLVPLVGLAVLALDRQRARFDAPERRIFVIPLVVLLVAPSVMAVRWVEARKEFVFSETRRVAATAEAATVGGARPLVVVWRTSPDGTSRRFFEVSDRIDVLNAPSLSGLFVLLDRSAVRRRGSVTVVTDLPIGIFMALAGQQLEGLGWEIDEGDAWQDADMMVLVLRPLVGSGSPRR